MNSVVVNCIFRTSRNSLVQGRLLVQNVNFINTGCNNNNIVSKIHRLTSRSHLQQHVFKGEVSGSSLYFHQPHRNAGHSKWANIKSTKTAKDAEKNKEATKYCSMMKIAAREGGSPDPKVNQKLAQILVQIRDAKLPMGTFERLLQNMQARKEAKTLLYPVKGPGSCIVLVEITSDNVNRTKQEVNTVLRKNKAIVVNESVLYQFNHKGLLFSSNLDGKEASEELLEETINHAIEVGAEDVVYHAEHPDFGRVFEFTTSPSAFFNVKHGLENMKYNIVHGDLDYLPISRVELNDEEIQAAHKLYEKLVDHPEVSRVYTNIA